MGDKRDWLEDLAEEAKKLFLQGLSSQQIADRLGNELTRSAVLGKLWRMGVKRSCAPAKRKQTHKPKGPRARRGQLVAPRPAIVDLPPDLAPEPIGEKGVVRAVEISGLNTCKAPLGEPESEEFRFCGQRCDGAYCG